MSDIDNLTVISPSNVRSHQQPSQSVYQPPTGFQPVASLNSPKPCRVSALDVSLAQTNELWVVRLPPSIRPKQLENLTLDLSRFLNRHSHETPSKVGELTVGAARYDVYAEQIPTANPSRSGEASVAPETKEISRMVPMLPDQANPQLSIFQAPTPISRVIFFRRRLDLIGPTQPSKISSSPRDISRSLKRVQPPGLEIRHVPFGAETIGFEYDSIRTPASHLKVSQLTPNLKRSVPGKLNPSKRKKTNS